MFQPDENRSKKDGIRIEPASNSKISLHSPSLNTINVQVIKLKKRVKFLYWGVLNYADSLCIKISPIFNIANPNPNPAGPDTPQYGNYAKKSSKLFFGNNPLLSDCHLEIV